jgi:hypothetical protein
MKAKVREGFIGIADGRIEKILPEDEISLPPWTHFRRTNSGKMVDIVKQKDFLGLPTGELPFSMTRFHPSNSENRQSRSTMESAPHVGKHARRSDPRDRDDESPAQDHRPSREQWRHARVAKDS